MPDGDDTLVLGFPECRDLGSGMAAAAGLPFECIELHRFPDGESLVRVPGELPADVVMFRTLDHPNEKLVELMFAADACRKQGAQSITLVAPYLCYMRQDIAFRPGEAVSQRIVGKWLGAAFDRVVTVDPHLHRTNSLAAAIPGAESLCLSASGLIGGFLGSRGERLMLFGPDEESRQWVGRIAETADMPFAVARKVRSGDRNVDVALPEGFDCRGQHVVLVDDVASTGHTLAAAARKLLAGGAARVDCVITHPVFCDGALTTLHDAGIVEVWSANSISHATNAVFLDELLAESLSLPAGGG